MFYQDCTCSSILTFSIIKVLRVAVSHYWILLKIIWTQRKYSKTVVAFYCKVMKSDHNNINFLIYTHGFKILLYSETAAEQPVDTFTGSNRFSTQLVHVTQWMSNCDVGMFFQTKYSMACKYKLSRFIVSSITCDTMYYANIIIFHPTYKIFIQLIKGDIQ